MKKGKNFKEKTIFKREEMKEKIILIIAKNIFFDFLFIILLTIIIGGALYCRYYFLKKGSEVEAFKNPFILNNKDYLKVDSFWQKKQLELKKIDLNKYNNPFIEKKAISSSSSIEASNN